MKYHAVAAAVLLALGGGARAQTNAELKATLDQALKTIQELQTRVKTLEQQKPASAAPASTAAAPATWGAPVGAPGSRAEEGAPDAGKARVEFYGQAMLDAIYDARRMDPSWNATLRPSKIPVGCPGAAGCGQDGATIFSIRQSSLGFKSFIPTTMGEIKTDLAFDLFGTDGSTSIHWLRAWAEVGMFGVGQTDSNFMDIDVFPNTVDYWGPSGMVFVRNPQLRLTPFSKDGMSVVFTLEAPNSAIDTGKVSEVDPALGASIAGWTRLPDAVGSFRLDGNWGHAKAAAILRQVGYQNTAGANGEPSGVRTGYGLNLAGTFNVFGKDRFNWQVVSGRAIASYMNDGGVDLAPDGNLQAETVASLGWLAYYNHTWGDKWTTAIGYSEHRQTNTEGQLGNAFQKGSYSSLNLLYAPAKNITTGAEAVWGKLAVKDGSSAIDYRLQFTTRVTF
jgi:DcaP outer membrane protein